jgi:putative membrane protein
MIYPSFVIGDLLAPEGWKRGPRVLAVAALGGMAMTAWDLVMDPIMVSTGHWVWDTNGPYFGIPLQNFWGWWLTVFVIFGLYMLTSGKAPPPADPGFDRLALVSYLVTALGIVAIAMLIGIGNLGLIGLFAMLPWVVTGWLRTREG